MRSSKHPHPSHQIIIRDNLGEPYNDVYTPAVLTALDVMMPFNADIKALMKVRVLKRLHRIENKEPINFLPSNETIPGSEILVKDAREGKFEGSEIPNDLKRQWIQGTGPGAKPNSPVDKSLRNMAYALFPGLMAGCLTERMPLVRLQPCHWIISAV